MRIGFLGFGEVASTISCWLTDAGAEVYTSLENRSDRTRNLAKRSSVNICDDDRTLAQTSDILISVVIPAEAVKIAEKVGKYSQGIYVDMNNVSPQTVKKALGHIKNGKTADAAIMGGIKKEGIGVQIIVSGNSAEQFSKLNAYGLNIKVIGPHIGQASALKMLRSSYTKGVSALLFESLYSAYQMGLHEELLKCLEKTECPGFRESAISRVITSTVHAERRAQEMEEVLEVLSDYQDPLMSRASAEFFKKLSKRDKLEKRRLDYKDLFEILSNESDTS